MVGRREADRVLTPRVRAIAIGAAVLALVPGAVLLKVLRTEGFSDRPVAAAAPVAAPEATVPVDTAEEPKLMETTRALRAADRGRQLLGRGEVKAALALLGDAVRALPEDAELADVYGTALWTFGARDHALYQFQRAVKLAPDAESYRQDLARALSALGRAPQAAHVLYGPGGPPLAADAGVPASSDEAVNLGGAGRGAFKGRTFTDADLQSAHAPAPAPSATPEQQPR